MKILLIEDRIKRQQLFMEETNIELDSYSDILFNCTGEAYDEVFYQLQNDTFDLTPYDIIISHKSAYGDKNTQTLEKLKKHCKDTNTPLIFFSGGISATYYNEEEYKVMELNSKTFYSKNLELFLEATKTEDKNILMLCYGRKWKLNIVLNILEKINFSLEKNDDDKIYYPEFVTDCDIEKLQILDMKLHEVVIENNRTSMDEIFLLKDSIYQFIKETTND
ncbi:MAG: hypothetical protein CL623_05885 [Arcobacter sp.]|nr:hypothetical protein [Arcobacter sp.]